MYFLDREQFQVRIYLSLYVSGNQYQSYSIMTAIRNADLIDKMNSSDKDFRFMAVNDLMENIKSKSITLDDATEQQVCYFFFIFHI